MTAAPVIRRCTRRKVIYLSEGEAQRKLDRNPRWGKGMHPYYCGDCQCWHVGHPRPGQRP